MKKSSGLSGISSLSIRFKILSLVFGGVVGILLVSGVNYMAISQNQTTLKNVRHVYFPVLERLDMNIVRLEKIKEAYSNAVAMAEEDVLEEVVEVVAMDFNKSLTEVAELEASQKDMTDRLINAFNTYIEDTNAFTLKMINEEIGSDEIKVLQNKMLKELSEVEGELNDFRTQSYQRFISAIEGAHMGSNTAIFTGVSSGFVILVLLMIVGFVVSRSIVNNIDNVVLSLKSLASGAGDLTARLTSSSNDEIGALVHAFNTFLGKLHGIIAMVKTSSEKVFDASGEMKKVAEMSVVGMHAQNEDISRVVQAMAEMSTTVSSVTEIAGKAAEYAASTKKEAELGNEVVTENMESISLLADEIEKAAQVIEALDKHSESIGTVLNVIRDIADQTNLLALNAAIEAARAGEQGRGFAVVADEVRTLANRTHESTQEINDMISRLQTGTKNAVNSMISGREQAQASVGNAGEVKGSLEKITQGIANISSMNMQIASATEEQNAVAKEINGNVANLGQVVAQLSEDSDIAKEKSDDVSVLIENLSNEISVFKI